jgi:ElaB/YqjD/DUF883 family membrane-anchored ribosome-binding protein
METNFDAMDKSLNEVTKEKLKNDLRVLVHDAEDLMKVTASDLGEKAREARAKLTATLESAKATCKRLEEKTIATAKAADHVIREHPYQSIGIAFGLGLLIGVLVNRK